MKIQFYYMGNIYEKDLDIKSITFVHDKTFKNLMNLKINNKLVYLDSITDTILLDSGKATPLSKHDCGMILSTLYELN